ncbi:hypothetical protein VEE53_34450 [Escherichia coli]|nr:hypothetical protein VEE53_34450 [Escherichia coli]
MVGEYIGSVLLGPLLLPVLVSGILCTFTKKTRNFASFTRGCCWVLGVLLLSNVGNTFRLFTPWHYTFEKAAISVTVPNRHWNTVSISTDGNDSNLLIVFYVQIMPDDFVMQLHRF